MTRCTVLVTTCSETSTATMRISRDSESHWPLNVVLLFREINDALDFWQLIRWLSSGEKHTGRHGHIIYIERYCCHCQLLNNSYRLCVCAHLSWVSWREVKDRSSVSFAEQHLLVGALVPVGSLVFLIYVNFISIHHLLLVAKLSRGGCSLRSRHLISTDTTSSSLGRTPRHSQSGPETVSPAGSRPDRKSVV